MRISFSIIGHNEGYLIEDCLKSIKDIAFEIVYVDCDSSDNSIDIVKKYTDRIYTQKNNLNLNVNKQFGIEKCTGDWVFYIDPDERLNDSVKKEILHVIKNTDCNGFIMPRRNYYFGEWLRYGGKYPDRQLRLFKNGKGKFDCVNLHERIRIDGRVGRLENPFDHIVIDNTDRMIKKMVFYMNGVAEENLKLNRKPEKVLSRSIKKFFSNYFFKLGFIDGVVGLFVALIDLFNGFLYYFRMRELMDK
jgi:(heptosyl)LPS beta-1,4-glucosyltransferase